MYIITYSEVFGQYTPSAYLKHLLEIEPDCCIITTDRQHYSIRRDDATLELIAEVVKDRDAAHFQLCIKKKQAYHFLGPCGKKTM